MIREDVFVDALSLPTPMRKRAAYRYGYADQHFRTRNRITNLISKLKDKIELHL
uniref:Uncharacterized protein n=1 Tax=Utricularia reniformis TaxID=192314 RepID=A0A1Y0B235_9LAMI|nr:hypothetical protein AEK19_MT1219 [Utricularia reniformis]ART31433.1 hypothetical protein AEK19_MT1219 [Utricularia reniformis]